MEQGHGVRRRNLTCGFLAGAAIGLGGQTEGAAAQPAQESGKMGVGADAARTGGSTVADLAGLGAAWFYDWGPEVPPLATEGWACGPGARRGQDGEVVLAAGGVARLEIACGGVAALEAGLTVQGGGGSLRVDVLNVQGFALLTFERRLAPPGLDIGAVQIPAGAVRLRLEAKGRGANMPLKLAWLRADGQRLDQDWGKMRFVPMIWCGADCIALPGLMARSGDTLLGFNEPDNPQQANMAVAEALALWPLLQATGRRLGAPAVTTPQMLGPASWLGGFMAGVAARGYQVDFMTVHYYAATPDVGAFGNFLNQVQAAYRRPVWVTEWALADWNAPGRYSPAEQAAFLAAAAPMLAALPFVERHAWFCAYPMPQGADINSALFSHDGAPSGAGAAFRRLAKATSS
jgi:hypothetical protein